MCLSLWEPYSGGLMYPARDLRHLPRDIDENAAFSDPALREIARPNTAPTGRG